MGTIYTFHNETDLDSVADADQFLVYDASAGRTKSATAVDLKVYAGGGVVDATAATLTVTQAAHANRTVTLNRAAGVTVTLPAASGTGDIYRFFVGTTVTSNNDIIKVANASDSMVGNAYVNQDAGGGVTGFEVAANDDTITLNGSTTGGIKGDYIEITDVATNLFSVRAFLSGTGTEATPFSATVS
jgi:hypothetical protein